jgi:DNA recombination protein RmuC
MGLVAMLLLGIAIGAVIGYLFARNRVAAADERARSAQEKAALIEGQLGARFAALSAEALDASTARFLEVAEGRLRTGGPRSSTSLSR